jgi:phosphoglycolate phosphatase
LRAACFGGKNPEALIFDLDGTLADSAPDIHRSLNAVLSRSGLPLLELKAVTLMIGGGPEVLVRKALRELGLVLEPDEIRHLSMSFQHTYLEQGNALTSLFRGAVDCLDHLARHEIPIGLCSNKPGHICHQLLLDLEIRSFFDAIQGSGTGLPTKPHPAALLAILHRLGARPERALYVGDSKTDVETARAAGVPVALVKYGYTAAPATTLGADWVVEGLWEIPSIWQSL